VAYYRWAVAARAQAILTRAVAAVAVAVAVAVAMAVAVAVAVAAVAVASHDTVVVPGRVSRPRAARIVALGSTGLDGLDA